MPRILNVALIGNPVLRERASIVADVSDPSLQVLIDDLFATMLEVDSVGLAAPQVYQSLRVFVMQSRKGELFPNAPYIGSSAKFVGELWLREFPKRMKQRDLQQFEAAVTVGFSHAQIDPEV